jgi:ApeA N-terminal domain 1
VRPQESDQTATEARQVGAAVSYKVVTLIAVHLFEHRKVNVTGYLSSEDSWRGRFWLPGQRDQDQRGVLTYSPDNGVLLTLIGGFDDAVWLPGTGSTHVLSERSRAWPVVHGIVGRMPVTLLDCVAASSKSYMFVGEVSEQEIRTSEALVGALLKEPDRQLFSGVTIELENLTEWDYRSDVVFEIERGENIPRSARWRIAVDPVDPRVVEVGDLTVELNRLYRMPSHDVLRGRLEASTFAASYLTVRSSEPRSVDEWMETAQIFQDLITLAMDGPCAVLKEALIPTDELRDDKESLTRDEIAVYARHVVTRGGRWEAQRRYRSGLIYLLPECLS